MKDRFIGIAIEGKRFVRMLLIPGTGIGDKTADRTGKAKPEGGKKKIPEKATFPSQSPIKLLKGEGEEQAFHCLFGLCC
jgi:hypothetical protein